MKANSIRKTLFLGLFAAMTSSAVPALAGQAVGWWGGNWTCTIDGRPARMNWRVVDAGETSCDGDTCSTTSAVAWKGSFSDNGSGWVPLTNPRRGDRGGLYFFHADGNKWYLPVPANNKSTGWTTWQGNRYPLSCWR
jgi:Family of unknown function (DUF6006)